MGYVLLFVRVGVLVCGVGRGLVCDRRNSVKRISYGR